MGSTREAGTHAGTEGFELPPADGIGNGFGEHAARRISLRKKQHTEWRAFHGILLGALEPRFSETAAPGRYPRPDCLRVSHCLNELSAHAQHARCPVGSRSHFRALALLLDNNHA